MVIDDPDDTHLVEMAFGGGFSMEEKEFAHVPGSVEKHLGSVAIRFGDIAMEGVDDALAEECAEAAGKDQEGSRDRKRHRLPLNGRICFIADDDVDGSDDDYDYEDLDGNVSDDDLYCDADDVDSYYDYINDVDNDYIDYNDNGDNNNDNK